MDYDGFVTRVEAMRRLGATLGVVCGQDLTVGGQNLAGGSFTFGYGFVGYTMVLRSGCGCDGFYAAESSREALPAYCSIGCVRCDYEPLHEKVSVTEIACPMHGTMINAGLNPKRWIVPNSSLYERRHARCPGLTARQRLRRAAKVG